MYLLLQEYTSVYIPNKEIRQDSDQTSGSSCASARNTGRADRHGGIRLGKIQTVGNSPGGLARALQILIVQERKGQTGPSGQDLKIQQRKL